MNTKCITFQIEEATIASIHKAMEDGTLTSRKLIDNYLERIKQYDKGSLKINSVISINPNAQQIADELDIAFQKNGFVGALHGIAVLLKDNIEAEGMPTTAASVNLKDCISKKDSEVVSRLRAAGAIVLAKMNLHEFAIGGETCSSLLGQTLNPYDYTRTPGGSSGGPAAGIAMNFGTIAIGTDTVNSIRSPSSACNLVGMHATYGLVSKSGVIPSSFTQDNVGPITRTIEDLACVLPVISGYDFKDSSTAWSISHTHESYLSFLKEDGLQGKRLGILKSFFGKETINQDVNDVMERSYVDLKAAGATLIEITDPLDAVTLQGEISADLYEFKVAINGYLSNLGSEALIHSLDELIAADNYFPGIGNSIKIANGNVMESPEYYVRMFKRQNLRNHIAEILAVNELDALIFPHQKRPAVPIGESQLERNGILGALTGFPAVVVPGGFTPITEDAPLGVPVGIEFITTDWREPELLEIVYSFEQATHHRKAPIIH